MISADGPEELVVEELRALVHEVFVAEEESARAEEVFLECPEDVETRINNANDVFFFSEAESLRRGKSYHARLNNGHLFCMSQSRP